MRKRKNKILLGGRRQRPLDPPMRYISKADRSYYDLILELPEGTCAFLQVADIATHEGLSCTMSISLIGITKPLRYSHVESTYNSIPHCTGSIHANRPQHKVYFHNQHDTFLRKNIVPTFPGKSKHYNCKGVYHIDISVTGTDFLNFILSLYNEVGRNKSYLHINQMKSFKDASRS